MASWEVTMIRDKKKSEFNMVVRYGNHGRDIVGYCTNDWKWNEFEFPSGTSATKINFQFTPDNKTCYGSFYLNPNENKLENGKIFSDENHKNQIGTLTAIKSSKKKENNRNGGVCGKRSLLAVTNNNYNNSNKNKNNNNDNDNGNPKKKRKLNIRVSKNMGFVQEITNEKQKLQEKLKTITQNENKLKNQMQRIK